MIAWIRNNAWVLLLAASIIAMVAVVTPAATGFFPHSTTNIWLWALNTRSDGDVWFNLDELAITGAILETGVLVVAIVLMLVLTLNVKKGTPVKGMNGILLACIIMLVASPVGYIIGAEAYDLGFWMDHVAGFGIYGPFIAAGLLLVTFFVMKKK